MENKLKPCPFCSGKAELHKHERFGIECLECGAGFATIFESAEEAIAAWNNRIEHPSILAQKMIIDDYKHQLFDLRQQLKATKQLVRDMYDVVALDTKAEIMSTRNTRATKICKVEETFIEPVTLDYIQEYRCHKCGEYSYMQILYSEDKINYCSHCGTKVIY